MTTPDLQRDRLDEWEAAASDAAADAFLEAQAAASRGDHRAARAALVRLEGVADPATDDELLTVGRQLRADMGVDPLLVGVAVVTAALFVVVGWLVVG